MQVQYHPFLYHAAWATRSREPLLDPELRAAMHLYLQSKVREYGGTSMAIGGVADHVHLVFSVPPQGSVAAVVGWLKATSSRWVNHLFRPGADFAWQRGYSAFSISAGDLLSTCAYVDGQEEHHRHGTLLPAYEELVMLRQRTYMMPRPMKNKESPYYWPVIM